MSFTNNSNGMYMPVAPAYGSGGFGNGMFGNDGAWWLLVLLFCTGGWGRGYGYGSGGGIADNYVLNSDMSYLSRQLSDGDNRIESKLDGVNNGLCDGFYTNAQLINGVNQNINTAANGLQNSITQNGYESRLATQQLGTQFQQCCCDNKAAIADLKYTNAQTTCDIKNAISNATRDIMANDNANYRSLHDEIVANRMEDLKTQIANQNQQIFNLQLAASQGAQSDYIIRSLSNPCCCNTNRCC